MIVEFKDKSLLAIKDDYMSALSVNGDKTIVTIDVQTKQYTLDSKDISSESWEGLLTYFKLGEA